MKRMRSVAFLAVAGTLAGQATQATAWGWQGHQYIGNLAYLLLNPNARNHVRTLLGPDVDLGHAAVWADCARSVEGSDPSNLTYNEHDRYAPKICGDFSPSERQAMVSYASRNWTQCPYKGALKECHKSYHFADVNVHDHQDYSRSYPGTQDYDVVQAIKAATSVLKCKANTTCPATSPFDIASKREALLMLAHFVGDVHQPLHVGAVYLDTSNQPGSDGPTVVPTAGGNVLLLSPGDETDNLHHAWDTVQKSVGTTPRQQAIDSACQIAPLPNPTTEPPEAWASQTVALGGQAYADMTFSPDPKHGYWDVQLTDKPTYTKAMSNRQAQQLIVAGARLAALLNSIWPSKKVATACK